MRVVRTGTRSLSSFRIAKRGRLRFFIADRRSSPESCDTSAINSDSTSGRSRFSILLQLDLIHDLDDVQIFFTRRGLDSTQIQEEESYPNTLKRRDAFSTMRRFRNLINSCEKQIGICEKIECGRYVNDVFLY